MKSLGPRKKGRLRGREAQRRFVAGEAKVAERNTGWGSGGSRGLRSSEKRGGRTNEKRRQT